MAIAHKCWGVTWAGTFLSPSVQLAAKCPLAAMSNITDCQARRAEFLICALDLPSVQELAVELGITDRRFLDRLAQDLRLHASIAEAPRSGRPVKYTDFVLQQAQSYMLDGVEAYWSKEDIVLGMIAIGILEEGTSVESFWERFTAYMRQQGTPVVYGCQRLTFALSLDHIKKRLRWCYAHSTQLTEEKIKSWWIVDEIVVEEGGHPKGK